MNSGVFPVPATRLARPRLPALGLLASGRRRVTRRGLQVVLGLLWLLDGGLQLQPFMLRASFATKVLAPAGGVQPPFVAVPVHWAAHLVAAHPVALDLPFATVQLLLGAGILVPRTARFALAASLPWVFGVWYFGEGLSGLASGHATLLSGAPGAVLLYGVIALAARPCKGRSDVAPARWLPLVWAALWGSAGILQLLPQNNSGKDIHDALLSGGCPGRLCGSVFSLADWVAAHGTLALVVLVAVEVSIGLAVLDRRTLPAGAGVGLAFALAVWAFAQNFGGLYTGQATDPNTAPLLVVIAIALVGARDGEQRQQDDPHRIPQPPWR